MTLIDLLKHQPIAHIPYVFKAIPLEILAAWTWGA